MENGPPLLMVVASEDESTCPITAWISPSKKGDVIRTHVSGTIGYLCLRSLTLNPLSHEGRLPLRLGPIVTTGHQIRKIWTAFRARN
jgi:hypothetical protein